MKSLLWVSVFFFSLGAFAQERLVHIQAQTQPERSRIADSGFSIENIDAEGVWIISDSTELPRIRKSGFVVLSESALPRVSPLDFPNQDSAYHNYSETLAFLRGLQSVYADISKIVSIGKSLEGRDLWALHINTSGEDLSRSSSSKPGMVYMANHHAREHLTNEVALLLAQHLLKNKEDPKLAPLLDGRDIWIIPMVNPDGAEWDISGTNGYRYWRKNRRPADSGSALDVGVDLNRNYGYKWGTGGSSALPQSDTYRGAEPFSEPETRAVRDFIVDHPNIKVLLTLHSYSELILYPWGHTNNAIDNSRDHAVFQKMAQTMSQWNHYTPEQSSDLYITSGDTTDWAYGERGIFAFTFELSPKNIGGFYPGAAMIPKAFNDNLQPALYMLDVAGDPYRVIAQQFQTGWETWLHQLGGSILTPGR